MIRSLRFAMAAALLGGCASPAVLRDFDSDGCSLFPDGARWRCCCVEHDAAYWRGGAVAERRRADAALRECVRASGSDALAASMYWGVRLGGTPWLPTGFRWAYGWGYGRGYRALSSAEHEAAERQLQAWREAPAAMPSAATGCLLR